MYRFINFLASMTASCMVVLARAVMSAAKKHKRVVLSSLNTDTAWLAPHIQTLPQVFSATWRHDTFKLKEQLSSTSIILQHMYRIKNSMWAWLERRWAWPPQA